MPPSKQIAAAARNNRAKAKVVPIQQPPVHPFDQQYGTDTGGLIPREQLLTGHRNDAHLTAYYGVAPSILNALIDLWMQTRPLYSIDRYQFLDLGAGKGRAVMTAALHPFAGVTGVELNPGLAAIAQANLQRFTAQADTLAPAQILAGDALEVPLPEGPLLVFLFHPFEAPVLRRVLRRLTAHGGASGQGKSSAHGKSSACSESIDLLYVNAEHAAVLDRDPAFTRVFQGLVPMSITDHVADLLEIAGQQEYGSTGDEICAIYRLHPPD